MAMKTIAVGIDLGTTNSCVSVFDVDSGSPRILEINGQTTFPSIVYFDKNEIKVGHEAKRMQLSHPENVVAESKRLIGRSMNEQEVKDFLKRTNSKNIVEDSNKRPLCNIKAINKQLRPDEIATYILSYIHTQLKQSYGENVKFSTVVTVPAYFQQTQRALTKDAAINAGFESVNIINEPTAASLVYKELKNKVVFVFDLGGGTLDCSILDITSTGSNDFNYESMVVKGHPFLGGEDLTHALQEYITDKIKDKYKVSSDQFDVKIETRISEEAERVKKSLSSIDQETINLPYLMIDKNTNDHIHASFQITKNEFNNLKKSKVLHEDIRKIVRDVLKSAKEKGIDIDSLVFVGGATIDPYIRQIVEELVGLKGICSRGPNIVVAEGASVYASSNLGQNSVFLIEKTTFDLGIETMGGVLTPVVPRDSSLPAMKSEVFSTAQDNQTQVAIMVYEGNRPMAKDNFLLGEMVIHNIPAAPRGIPQIEISFKVDEGGILHVSAIEKKSNISKSITIESRSGISEEEKKKMKEDAEKFAEQDELRKKLAEEKNLAVNTIHTAKSTIETNESKITNKEVIENLKASIIELETVTNKEHSPEEITTETIESIKEQNKKTSDVLSEVYKNIPQDNNHHENENNTNTNQNNNNDESVVE